MQSPAHPDAFPSSREIAATLRRELAGHNLRVVALAVLTAAAAVILWVATYAIAYWLTLLFLTSVKGIDTAVPAHFREVFCGIAGALIIFAEIDKRLHPDDRPRDHRSPGEIALDLVLAVPRVTLAIFGTLSAWQHLNAAELAQAAGLVELVARGHRLRVQSVPIEIPDDRQRERILFALQLAQFIEIKREDGDFRVTLNALRPQALRAGPP